ncbi:hypothetical protein MK559_08470 [Streptococcus gallolyticus subsp. gallolyticus]|uniref:hypothetical protein n=1 Tax=Streptococcus gallolyticus TaxID=315405 RepID=UPI000201B208|nr:hypothetical protein [Streptococcus gallolyticus]MCY7179022.1 hypothetical protein [Streptococcus gallolyticus subsp. gallolyticus]CBZ48544.1 hypothetical protein SGGBAA2069_c13720 [Streptococcus gallolyticus subsp. gallolyticus ATCC BAA-2069]CBZ49212.1 hypothetical protein SGGBAA2069_c20400 [Streptococcus gallolyticus subsp. gallolyticus ATCC BAA-2069]
MTITQEMELITLLSDVLPVLDGDIIQGLSPEARGLTRQKLIDQLQEDSASFSEGDMILLTYFNDSIQLLQTISDEDFQTVLEEQIALIDLKQGQSIFQELDDQQLIRLGEQLKAKSLKTTEEEEKTVSFLNRFFKPFH